MANSAGVKSPYTSAVKGTIWNDSRYSTMVLVWETLNADVCAKSDTDTR